MIKTKTIEVKAKGFCDVINITDQVSEFLKEVKIKNGQALVFVSGSTAGITTMEYEAGAIKDLQGFFERIIPQDAEYHHNKKWGDGNGFSHIRSAILGTSLAIPIIDNNLALGTWQQIVLVDFDNRKRSRRVIIQVQGE